MPSHTGPRTTIRTWMRKLPPPDLEQNPVKREAQYVDIQRTFLNDASLVFTANLGATAAWRNNVQWTRGPCNWSRVRRDSHDTEFLVPDSAHPPAVTRTEVVSSGWIRGDIPGSHLVSVPAHADPRVAVLRRAHPERAWSRFRAGGRDYGCAVHGNCQPVHRFRCRPWRCLVLRVALSLIGDGLAEKR